MNYFILLLVLVSVFPLCKSHNWVNGPSRATMASVVNPCQTRVSADPHIQIIRNQTFQLEWSVGHGDSGTTWFYFVVLHESALDNLRTITTADIDDYLNNAPNAAAWQNGSYWEKNHVAHPAGFY